MWFVSALMAATGYGLKRMTSHVWNELSRAWMSPKVCHELSLKNGDVGLSL